MIFLWLTKYSTASLNRVHRLFQVGLLCFLTISIGCETKEQKARNEILDLFQQYKTAINSPDAVEKMYPLLTNLYISEFKTDMDYALHQPKEMLRFIPFQEKAMILSMRHKVTPKVLASGDSKEVLKSLLKDDVSFLPEDTPLTKLAFVSDHSAIGIYRTALFSKSILFYKNQKTGPWLLDPRGDYSIQKAEMQKLIEENKAKGISEEDMLKTVVFGLSASADSVLKWDPLMPEIK
jgi:hypothetical protein